MNLLKDIKPYNVMHWFGEIAKIPHGSGNTDKISEFCENFAKERNLEYYRDSDNNVIIIKPASVGYENSEPVILQGHLDMVCEKTADSDFDFEKDSLRLNRDGDYIYAENTTLGGDDGIAVAMALAILDSSEIAHPRLEAVFTIDEEIGMIGAQSIDLSMLKGKRLINIDSEVEGVFTVSCAGGNVTKCTLPIVTEDYNGDAFEIKVSGLLGGHSGVEIDKGRANASILLGRVINDIAEKTDMKLISVSGGMKDNAIPALATALVSANEETVNNSVNKFGEIFANEYRAKDGAISVTVTKTNVNGKVMDKASAEKVVTFLTCAPNGIIKMSGEIEGLVESSLNLGILQTEEDSVFASFCVRSSLTSGKEQIVRNLKALTNILGGSVEVAGDYPAWEYKADSTLRDLMQKVFIEQYQKEPVIEAIHAGLECGLFCGKIEGLDAVSIGPSLLDIHTPKERMSISSVERTWNFVLEILRQMK